MPLADKMFTCEGTSKPSVAASHGLLRLSYFEHGKLHHRSTCSAATVLVCLPEMVCIPLRAKHSAHLLLESADSVLQAARHLPAHRWTEFCLHLAHGE